MSIVNQVRLTCAQRAIFHSCSIFPLLAAAAAISVADDDEELSLILVEIVSWQSCENRLSPSMEIVSGRSVGSFSS